MNYEIKYVAFLDILGFSKYVGDPTNIDNVRKLFSFAKNFCDFYNSTPNLNVNASFFSDSVVLSSSGFGELLIAIYMAEDFVKNNLELLFRGGIYKGEIFFSKNTLFGPAVVKGYDLEKRAGFSRILIDESVDDIASECLEVFQDIDGFKYVNPYGRCIHDGTLFGPEGVDYPQGDPGEIIISCVLDARRALLEMIRKHQGNSVVEKYLWRIRPFNYTCEFLAKNSDIIPMFQQLKYKANDDFVKRLRTCQIGDLQAALDDSEFERTSILR